MYAKHPCKFNGGCDAEKAEQLIKAIYNLNTSGYFPDAVDDLTNRLVPLFDDIEPDKDGNKKLDNIIYYKAGIIKDPQGYYVIATPFETQKPETDDVSDRIRLINETMKYAYEINKQHTLKQLAFAMSGKKPGTRNGVVGKSLFRIEQLVSKMEGFLEQNPDTDRRVVFHDALLKIQKETSGPLDTYVQNKLYNYSYKHSTGRLNHSLSSPVYIITYAEGDVIQDVAEQMLKGTLTEKRVHNIMDTVHGHRNTVKFVPLDSLIDVGTQFCQKDYKNRVTRCVQDHGVTLSEYATFRNSSGNEYHQNTFYSMECYAENLITNKSKLIAPIYDAIQAYTAYDSIQDEKAREFLTAAGYLVKDWKPDPELWLRAARIMPAWFNQDERYMFGGTTLKLDLETVNDVISIAEDHADKKLRFMKDWLSSKETQELIQRLLD